jgi:hypothetical protein
MPVFTPVGVNYRCSSESSAATETTRSASLLLFPLNVRNWVSATKNRRLTKVVSGRRRVASYVVAFAHSLPEKEHRRARFLDFLHLFVAGAQRRETAATIRGRRNAASDFNDSRRMRARRCGRPKLTSFRRGEENENIQLLETRPSEPQPRCSFPPHFPATSAMGF